MNQWEKWENDRRNYFMTNLHERNIAELGFELATSGSAVRRSVSSHKVLEPKIADAKYIC